MSALSLSARFDAADLGEQAHWRLLEMIYADRHILWANLVLNIAIGLLVLNELRTGLAAAWACSGVILAILRLCDFFTFAKLRRRNALGRAARRLMILSCALGVHWGCASFIVLLTPNTLVWLYVISCQTSFLTHAVARNHPMAKSAYCQILLTVLPLILATELVPNLYINIYGGLSLLYLFASFGIVRHLHGRTLQLIRADEQNAVLLQRENEAKSRLEEANRQLEAANRQLETLAVTDKLTGIANRHRLDAALKKAWLRADRKSGSLGLLIADIDRFKDYNDTFGHPAGDDCLRRVAACIAGCVERPDDLAARHGGEEFAVLLPDSDSHGTIMAAERIRAAVQALNLPAPSGGPVTISVGAATAEFLAPSRSAADEGINALIAEADRNLYEAKKAGRNCVRGTAEASIIYNISGP
jgi:diguanylate cyclase (GGDEF)-like protein